jgi:hypothetical protein
MSSNNLRIIYKNLADAATITVSSTAGTTNKSNMANNIKSLVWRSVGTSAVITVDFSTSSTVSGVILPFCNLSSTATIRVQGFTTAGGTGTPAANADTGTILACPYTQLGTWPGNTVPLGVNLYSYGGSIYARAWFPNNQQPSCLSLSITITDTSNSSGYIEISRLVIGPYWSPTFNTSFGISVSIKDLSENSRTEAGDLITNIGTRANIMTFDLKYLNPTDRTEISNIIKGLGISKPLFVSLFPSDTDITKEQTYQIYGKLSQLNELVYSMFDIYNTTINIEEI